MATTPPGVMYAFNGGVPPNPTGIKAPMSAMPLPQMNPNLPSAPTPGQLPTLDSLFFGSNLNFSDINARLSANRTIAPTAAPGRTVLPTLGTAAGGQDSLFQKGVMSATPSAGIDPSLQSVLDIIRGQTNTAATKGMSEAQALAVRRGLSGSSVEQFGTQQALGEAEKAGLDSQTQVLIQDSIRKQQLQDLMSRAMFDRSSLEYSTNATQGAQQGQMDQNLNLAMFDANNQRATQNAQLGLQQDQAGATAMSDELASRRNMVAYMQQMDLQRQLGQQGIDLGYANIGASRDIARSDQQAGLLSAGINAFLPSLLGGGKGGGLASLFGGGGGAGATMAGVANPGAAGAASSLFPSMGGVGTGVPAGSFLPSLGAVAGGAGLGMLGGMAGNAAFGGGNDLGAFLGGGAGFLLGGPMGAGAGAFLGTGAQRLGGTAYTGLKGSIGNTGAAVLRPFIDPVGTIKDIASNPGKVVSNVASSVSNAISSVFRF